MEDPIVESVFDFIKETWLFFAVLILGYLVWKYNLIMGVLGVVGTIFLGWLAWKLWLHYVQQDFISGIDFVLLEIVPPREVLRNPKAMELFIRPVSSNFLPIWATELPLGIKKSTNLLSLETGENKLLM